MTNTWYFIPTTRRTRWRPTASLLNAAIAIASDLHRNVAHVQELNQAVLRRIGEADSSISGRDAANYIEKCIVETESILLNRHNGYSPAQWLWYLRRTPDTLFAGDLPSALGYDRALAEAYISRQVNGRRRRPRITAYIPNQRAWLPASVVIRPNPSMGHLP